MRARPCAASAGVRCCSVPPPSQHGRTFRNSPGPPTVAIRVLSSSSCVVRWTGSRRWRRSAIRITPPCMDRLRSRPTGRMRRLDWIPSLRCIPPCRNSHGCTGTKRPPWCTRWRPPIVSARTSTARMCSKAALPGRGGCSRAGSTGRSRTCRAASG